VNIRIAIAFDNFGPYHVARLAGAAQHAEVLAVETAATSSQYGWDAPETPAALKHAVLFDSEDSITRASLAAAIERELSAFAPNAVAVPGWSSATALAITRWAVEHHIPGGDHGRLPEAARGCYFLASCRFVPKKNLAQMLDAYALFRRDRGDDPADWPLVLLGDGELRPTLEAQRDRLGLSAHLHMPGFRQYDELPSYYGTAGCFVHASTTEQWGLVVNEAMAAGLPVIVSNRCGCAPVLVRDGANGYSFTPGTVDALDDPMRAMASRTDYAAMRQASRALVAEWGPDRFGQGMADAARYAAAAPAARPSLMARMAMALAVTRTPLR